MRIIGLILFLCLTTNTQAHADYIVRLKNNENPFVFGMNHDVTLKPISEDLGIYLAKPLQNSFVKSNLASIQQESAVAYAQENHPVVLRQGVSLPNDTNIADQWNWGLGSGQLGVDALQAWSKYGTGGQDVLGHEIVIAVVDGGFDYRHSDLINNAWVNKGEIPDNRIDDDGNGYIDDISGWNTMRDNGKISIESHGTHIAGIMGAEGNNGLFVSGINWKVKIMYISAGGFGLSETATVMASYAYILKQKQIWLASGGTQGANVVAINSSFGINNGDCTTGEYTVWNDMFNELGKAGVLSIAATANENWNVDAVGDVPTTCNSDFLITVTSSDVKGSKVDDAGFGSRSIDIAAPGEEIFSTLPANRAGLMSGTSMAAPHVTGAVGYLYSAASAAFINKSLSEPGNAALELKAILLNSVTKESQLTSFVGTGGVLNLDRASDMIATF